MPLMIRDTTVSYERRSNLYAVIYQFSYDSPVRYLPLAYMLPYDVISRYPTLSKLPRSMGALNASPDGQGHFEPGSS